MPASRQASCSQAAPKKRTFHVLIQPDISCANDNFYNFTVVSKLKCPLFRAHDMSGLRLRDRRRGCGKVGIPRVVRDSQAEWKSPPLGFSTQRLFHSLSPAIQFALGQTGPSLRVIAAHDMRPIPNAPALVQMFADRDRTSGQSSPPARRFDL